MLPCAEKIDRCDIASFHPAVSRNPVQHKETIQNIEKSVPAVAFVTPEEGPAGTL